MDIHTTDKDGNGKGIPTEAKEWEAWILSHQQKASPKSVSKRRRTVHGIPTFTDFTREHEEREQWAQQPRRRPRQDSHQQQTAAEEKDGQGGSFEGILFDGSFSDRSASLPRSYSSSTTSARRLSPRAIRHHPAPRHHHQSSGSSRHRGRPAFKSTPELPRPDSPTSFEERVVKDKARYYSQPQGKRARHFQSHLNATMFAQQAPHESARPSPAPRPAPDPILSHPPNLYLSWREECDLQLKDKTTMTHIPKPPISTCIDCTNSAIIGGHVAPIACTHSLSQLLRTGVPSSASKVNTTKAYLAILKTERHRWHTDRFGACSEGVKPNILHAAQQLFVILNELFEAEKLRLEQLPPEMVFGAHTSSRPPAQEYCFDFEEVRAW